MAEERAVNQDMLVDVILHYNAIERTLYALGLLHGESGLFSSYRAAEDGEDSLTEYITEPTRAATTTARGTPEQHEVM